MNLSNLDINRSSYIACISNSPSVKQRLADLGIIVGTKITPILTSPSGHIRAYFVKDTLLAIRDEDAVKIEVDNYKR